MMRIVIGDRHAIAEDRMHDDLDFVEREVKLPTPLTQFWLEVTELTNDRPNLIGIARELDRKSVV